jgi:hypothetical protein
MPKISSYPDGGALQSSDLFVIARSGNNFKILGSLLLLNLPDGTMLNGKLVPSVDGSNNMTLAIKTLAGNDPSASDSVKVKISGTWRTVSAALSVTVNAGANSFNAGSTELATYMVQYFKYLGWRAASSAVVIGFGRIPGARLYSDFDGTATNEKYGAFSTVPAAGDAVANVGRFDATLSAGAGYTWTIPTATNKTNIDEPIFETDWLTWNTTWTGSGALTFTAVTNNILRYKIDYDKCMVEIQAVGTLGGVANIAIRQTAPFGGNPTDMATSASPTIGGAMISDSATGLIFGGAFLENASPDTIAYIKYNLANFSNSGAGQAQTSGFYRI